MDQCTRPTLLEVAEFGKIKLVRRQYNITKEAISQRIHKIGEWTTWTLTDREAERYKLTPNESVAVRITYSGIIGCGQCPYCLKKRAKQLTNRIILDNQECGLDAVFITLTYNDQYLPANKQLQKTDAIKIRNEIKKKLPDTKYLIVGEYGTHTGRPHYHALLWNIYIEDIYELFKPFIPRSYGTDYITYQAESNIWTKGDIYISKANAGTIGYTAQYAEKKRLRNKEEKDNWKKQGLQPELQLMSKGIAFNYYEHHYKELIKNHGKYTDEQHYEKTIDKSFIDYIKTRHPEYAELKATNLFKTILNTYQDNNDNNNIRSQREKNALNNEIRKERE